MHWPTADLAGLEGWDGEELPERTRERAAGSRNSYEMADAKLEQRDRRSDWSCGWQREPEETLRDARRGGGEEAWMSIPESLLGRVAHGIPSRVDRLRRTEEMPSSPSNPKMMIARRIKQALETQRVALIGRPSCSPLTIPRLLLSWWDGHR